MSKLKTPPDPVELLRLSYAWRNFDVWFRDVEEGKKLWKETEEDFKRQGRELAREAQRRGLDGMKILEATRLVLFRVHGALLKCICPGDVGRRDFCMICSREKFRGEVLRKGADEPLSEPELTRLQLLLEAEAAGTPGEATDRRNDEKARRSLRHRGAGWELLFDETSAVYPEMLGFDYLAILLSKPEHGFELAELIVKAGKFDGDSRTMRGASEAGKQKGKSGEAQKPTRRTEDSILDDEAAKSCARRLAELPDLIEKAESDAERAKLEEERAFLTDELRKAANQRGIMRKLNPNADRVAITNAIADALDRIKKHQPEAAAWLRANLETGKAPRYFGPDCWDVER